METLTLQNVDRDGTIDGALDQLRDWQDRKCDAVLTESMEVQPIVTVDGGSWRGGLAFTTPTVERLDGAVLYPSRHAHGQIAERAGIPRRYYDRMLEEQPALWQRNVQTWWDAGRRERLVRTYLGAEDPHGEGSRVRAWLSSRFRVLDNLPFIEAVLQAVNDRHGDAFQVAALNVRDERIYMKIATPATEASAVGEAVQQGIIVSNSEVGAGKVKVAPFAVVLACMNGMVSTQKYDHIHLGGDLDTGLLEQDTIHARANAVWKEVRDFVNAALDPAHLHRFVELLEDARGVETETPAREAVGNVVRRYGLSGGDGSRILDRFLRDAHQHGETKAGLVQAVTYEAHQSETAERQIELEELGGELLEMENSRFLGMVRSRISGKVLEKTFSTN